MAPRPWLPQSAPFAEICGLTPPLRMRIFCGAKRERAEIEDAARTLPRARASLDHALDDSPHLSGAWLLLAGLASRFPSLGLDATELLKVSYYTGPSEQDLLPLRLRIAVHADDFDDAEIRQFVSRDIRHLLARKQKSAIAEAYDAASSCRKELHRTNPYGCRSVCSRCAQNRHAETRVTGLNK